MEKQIIAENLMLVLIIRQRVMKKLDVSLDYSPVMKPMTELKATY